MNANKLTREQISSFVDGELPVEEFEQILALLKTEEGRQAWATFHGIGDALRSEEMAIELSDGFSKSMSDRLAAEPTIIAPVNRKLGNSRDVGGAGNSRVYARLAWPIAVTAVAAAAALVLMPPSFYRSKDDSIYAGGKADPRKLATANPSAPNAVLATVDSEETLRDPRLEQYLQAHEQFSPSLSSSAQYARSASFTVEADK